MILYLDTSALVKLYVEEAGSARTRELVDRSDGAYTSRISYVEARAAFARRLRAQAMSRREHGDIVSRFEAGWSGFGVVELSDPLARSAGTLAEKHGLRALDATQLAAALELRTGSVPVDFACFDRRLAHAAREERLPLAASL
ncbi:MAG: type II toxin-antitoxin system VapC family toxin [Deltaproteobacteria bacterium]|nr:type II toxin-antitoxin system VapC family toxin [Deltaproteobacteria bacterium]